MGFGGGHGGGWLVAQVHLLLQTGLACTPACVLPFPSHTPNNPKSIPQAQISGAAIKEMAPGQRAEINAIRNALGSDYEARLRAEAGACLLPPCNAGLQGGACCLLLRASSGRAGD